MFAQKLTTVLTTAFVSAALLAGAMQTPAFANMGGGDGGGYSDVPMIKFNMPKKQNRPWARSTDRKTGETTTSRGASDGSRYITVIDRDGRVIRTERVEGRKKVDKKDRKKNKKVAKKRGRAWASSYDRDTGRRTTSISNGDGTRSVFSIGPFHFGFSISR